MRFLTKNENQPNEDSRLIICGKIQGKRSYIVIRVIIVYPKGQSSSAPLARKQIRALKHLKSAARKTVLIRGATGCALLTRGYSYITTSR